MTKRFSTKLTMRTLSTTDLPNVQGGADAVKPADKQVYLVYQLKNVLVSSY